MVEFEELPDAPPVDREQLIDEAISEWERRRYVPKPGEPDLPPQLAEHKTVDEVMKEINSMPFFMTQLDPEALDNVQLEALKLLAYEGEPDEVATNFKNQGNDCYKAKQFSNAIDYYNKALAVDGKSNSVKAALYLNRAACNLELKNYRRCINDCKECMLLDPSNFKACFRAGTAYFLIAKYEEAIEILKYGLTLDQDNLALKGLLKKIEDKLIRLAEIEAKRLKLQKEKELVELNLAQAIVRRQMTLINTSKPIELLENSKLKLEDPKDQESQLIFPALVLYPTTDEFDFVAEISELTTAYELMELVMSRPDSYFQDPKHQNFRPNKLQLYMETINGGLIKVGKKVPLNECLMNPSVKVPIFDNALRIYFVPKVDAESWLKTWDKSKALERRK